MKTRINDLSEEREQQVRNHFDRLRDRIDRHVDDVLADLDGESTRESVRYVAFSPNEVLPKRSVRPKIESCHLVDQLALAYDLEPEKRDDLLCVTLLVTEYFDIADDVADNDVPDESLLQVMTVHSILGALLTRRLHTLGTEAVEYWTEQAISVSESWQLEAMKQPGADAYLDVLDRQAALFGVLTGLVAVVAGEGPDDVEQAETIGKTYFLFEQVLLDLEQAVGGGDGPWNAWTLMATEDVEAILETWREQADELLAVFPAERRRLIRALFATDVSAFRRELTA